MQFNKITIVGLGLIGGSLAWALKESDQVETVVGVDPDQETIQYALESGIIDTGTSDINDVAAGSDIIVIATHVGLILRQLTPCTNAHQKAQSLRMLEALSLQL